ncbi:hypothetical protein AURDEDRAFT_159377 [Auricularia subglabra TFB-10046 SS5]|nr:hypothetical protein AURDEDRAFT_159377 [Auricularia subglabra TFB-10046 SS5]
MPKAKKTKVHKASGDQPGDPDNPDADTAPSAPAGRPRGRPPKKPGARRPPPPATRVQPPRHVRPPRPANVYFDDSDQRRVDEARERELALAAERKRLRQLAAVAHQGQPAAPAPVGQLLPHTAQPVVPHAAQPPVAFQNNAHQAAPRVPAAPAQQRQPSPPPPEHGRPHRAAPVPQPPVDMLVPAHIPRTNGQPASSASHAHAALSTQAVNPAAHPTSSAAHPPPQRGPAPLSSVWPPVARGGGAIAGADRPASLPAVSRPPPLGVSAQEPHGATSALTGPAVERSQPARSEAAMRAAAAADARFRSAALQQQPVPPPPQQPSDLQSAAPSAAAARSSRASRSRPVDPPAPFIAPTSSEDLRAHAPPSTHTQGQGAQPAPARRVVEDSRHDRDVPVVAEHNAAPRREAPPAADKSSHPTASSVSPNLSPSAVAPAPPQHAPNEVDTAALGPDSARPPSPSGKHDTSPPVDTSARIIVFLTAAGAVPSAFVRTDMFVATYNPAKGLPNVRRMLTIARQLPDIFSGARELFVRACEPCTSAAVHSCDSLPRPSSYNAPQHADLAPPGVVRQHGTLADLLSSSAPPLPLLCINPPERLEKYRSYLSSPSQPPVHAVHLFISHYMLRNPSQPVPSLAPTVPAIVLPHHGVLAAGTAEDPMDVDALELTFRRPAPSSSRAASSSMAASSSRVPYTPRERSETPPPVPVSHHDPEVLIRSRYADAVDDIAYCNDLIHPNRRAAILAEIGRGDRVIPIIYGTAFASYRIWAQVRRVCGYLGLKIEKPGQSRQVTLGTPRTFAVTPNMVCNALGAAQGTWRNMKTRFRHLDKVELAIDAARKDPGLPQHRKDELDELLHRLSFYLSDVGRIDPRQRPADYEHEYAVVEWKTSEFEDATQPWRPPSSSAA